MFPAESASLPERVELTHVPFFPQAEYQCGPAALATLLVARGVPTAPAELVERVYLPGRQGSLQVEMVAAARTHGLLVYPLEPELSDVLTEVAAGNPVLVLQNLAFDRWPQWHFAVVVGYDLGQQRLILRSGTSERKMESFRLFERYWAKSSRWAVVVVKPDQLPQTAALVPWLQAASDLEQSGQGEMARLAYRSASQRWSSGLPWFALGNSLYATGDRVGAEQALRKSVAQEPTLSAAWINLAHLLNERNCAIQAAYARSCADRLMKKMPVDSDHAVPDKVTDNCEMIARCMVR